MMELISHIDQTAILWEPLHLSYVKKFAEAGFGWRQHIPKQESLAPARKIFAEVLSGKVLNSWTTLKTDPATLLAAKQLIVKFCRGNALLPWLADQFKFTYPPVYLIRHPFAVIASQMKFGAWEQPIKNGFDIPATRYNEPYLKHKKYLSGLQYKEEHLAAHWCVSNLIPLTDEKNNIEWITVNYENLVLNPKQEIQRIFSRWNLPIPEQLFSAIDHPSSTTIAGSPLKGIAQLSYWKERLQKQQIHRMLKVLEYFEVPFYGEDIMPKISFS